MISLMDLDTRLISKREVINIFRKIQIQVIMILRYHFIPTSMSVRQIITSVHKNAEKLELLYFAVGM